jgi:hypothetical protein
MDGVAFEHKRGASPLHLAARTLHGNVPRTEFDLVNTAHRPRDDSAGRMACVARCGGLLAVGGITGLLLVGATYCSATIQRLKISTISSNA